jgi:DNA-binding SARP family transcriptional activator
MATFAVEEVDRSVAVGVLGSFRVIRDGVAVPRRDWQSRKARDLLKLLVARLGRPAPRDWLLEALWPEQDPRRTRPRLSVALSTVRAVLDPVHHFGAEHYVWANRDAVAVDTQTLVVDLERFLARAEAALAPARSEPGQAAVAELEAAEASYGGDFLEDELYEDWTIVPREQAREMYIAVTRALIELAAARGDHGSVVHFALRLLERDPFDESAHLAVVAARTAERAHGEAQRAYDLYVARMDEIGVRPAPLPQAV